MAARQAIATGRAGAVAMPVADGRGADESDADRTDQRRCIGSVKFGIVAHDAPVAEFPAQPSQKDGLGRMCKVHWNAYTNALRKASIARKATEAEAAEPEPAPAKAKRRGKTAGEAEGDAA
jgi:hypothetical protein